METPLAGGRGARYALLLRNSAYFRVFSAGLGSVLGTAIAAVCIVWLVFSATGSAWDVALVGVANLAGTIVFSIFGGVLVDRYDRRRLMILSDVVRSASLVGVVFALALRGFDLAVLLGANVLLGAFYTVFNPAEMSLVPSIVAAGQVADANGLVTSSRSVSQFVGASVAGGLIVTVGPTAGIAFNAVTFAVSALLLYGMRTPPSPGSGRAWLPGLSTWSREIREGFAWIWTARGFLELTASASIFNFCLTVVSTFLIVFSTLVLHGSALVYAFLAASVVAGTAIGSLLVGPLHGERRLGLSWTVGCGLGAGACLVALVAAATSPVAVAALFGLGVGVGFGGTSWLTGAQLLVPREIQGRYFGIDALGSTATVPLGQVGGALLIGAYGIRSTYWVVALVWVAAGLVFLLPRALRTLGVRPGSAVSLRSAAGGAETTGWPGETRGG